MIIYNIYTLDYNLLDSRQNRYSDANAQYLNNIIITSLRSCTPAALTSQSAYSHWSFRIKLSRAISRIDGVFFFADSRGLIDLGCGSPCTLDLYTSTCPCVCRCPLPHRRSSAASNACKTRLTTSLGHSTSPTLEKTLHVV